MKLSKSKLALAKVINENGGWVGVADCATQDKDGWVCSYEGKPTRCGDSWKDNGDCLYKYGFDSGEKIQNWHQCVLSREEYYHAYPKADDDWWIEWKGGECPVDADAIIDVKQEDGDEFLGVDADWDWRHGSGCDIIAYRLHKPDVRPEFCESVTSSVPDPESKPTIEQLAQDYRNKLDFANSKQQEADEAKAAADAALSELERAGEEIGLLLSPIQEGKKPEINIIDWRDLMVGDEIICSEDGNWNCDLAGNVCVVREIESQEYTGSMPILAEYCDASDWGDKFTFVRRP